MQIKVSSLIAIAIVSVKRFCFSYYVVSCFIQLFFSNHTHNQYALFSDHSILCSKNCHIDIQQWMNKQHCQRPIAKKSWASFQSFLCPFITITTGSVRVQNQNYIELFVVTDSTHPFCKLTQYQMAIAFSFSETKIYHILITKLRMYKLSLSSEPIIQQLS